MDKKVRVRGIRRKDVDTAGLALAFLMLARLLHEHEMAEAESSGEPTNEATNPVAGTNELEATS